MSPSPFTRHQRVVLRLSSVLHDFVQEQKLGEVFVAPLDVYLNDINVYQPDIVFLSKQRMNQVADKGIEGAPDLCIEVLSKSTERFDRVIKKKVFAQAGLKHYWLVDPESKTLAAFDLMENPEKPSQVAVVGTMFRSEVFPGLEISMADLFHSL